MKLLSRSLCAAILTIAIHSGVYAQNMDDVKDFCIGQRTLVIETERGTVTLEPGDQVTGDTEGIKITRPGLPERTVPFDGGYIECITTLSREFGLSKPDARLERLEDDILALADDCENGNADSDGSAKRRIMASMLRYENNARMDQDALEALSQHFDDVQEFCIQQFFAWPAENMRVFSFGGFGGALLPHKFLTRISTVDVAFDLFIAGKRCGGKWTSHGKQNVEYCDISGGESFELRNIELLTSLVPPSERSRLPAVESRICQGRYNLKDADDYNIFICFDGHFTCDLVAASAPPRSDGSFPTFSSIDFEETLQAMDRVKDACLFSGSR